MYGAGAGPVSGPAVIAVAGCSGSGKTTLAEELARELEGTHFHLDHYYCDLSHLPFAERVSRNFDHPDELDLPLLLAHIRALVDGRVIARPLYDFSAYTRVAGRTERVEERHVLVIDGIFALHFPGLRALTDLGIYVDTPDEICFERRLARDVRDRGRTPESVAAHYAATVRPMAEQFVRPSAAFADLIVDGTQSLDWAVEEALAAIHTRGLLGAGREQPLGFS